MTVGVPEGWCVRAFLAAVSFRVGMALFLALEVTEDQKKGNVNDKVPAPIT